MVQGTIPKNKNNYPNRLITLILVLFALGFAGSVSAQKAPKNTVKTNEFQAGEFVVHDVSDSHEWHLTTFGKHEVSIPLPIIIYSKNSGWHGFSSAHFNHGTASYENFRMETSGKNTGKIVELNDQGQIVGFPFDISITKTVFGIIFSAILLIFILLKVARSTQKRPNQAPRGLQNLLEPVIIFVRDDIAVSIIGKENSKRYVSFLLSVFFFILLNNLLGLIPLFPFGANVTGNSAVTMVMAAFTFAITSFSGKKHYWKEIFNPDVPWWLKFPIPIMPMVEFIGFLSKPIVLMIRLFANMLAGHMIVIVFVALIFITASLANPWTGMAISPLSVGFGIFILLMDVLISFIQAYVFTLLSALYFSMAIEEPQEVKK